MNSSCSLRQRCCHQVEGAAGSRWSTVTSSATGTGSGSASARQARTVATCWRSGYTSRTPEELTTAVNFAPESVEDIPAASHIGRTNESHS
ncbi:hypothetical protein O6P43_002201 [Quillaja saponaria]|uniref:Uncharacterized protein n=1 Tax=Quillaja saponaria TaxID=32244 RepID=A0AAD7VJZ1_QUISA|nr:hypothetical protein O6P43_002201 [Quillaja saponaria]